MVEKLRDFSGQRRQAIPHDLFDLYHLSRNIDRVERVIEAFPQKCKVKGISLDSIDLKKVVARKSEYENNWKLGLEYLIPKNLKVSFEWRGILQLDFWRRRFKKIIRRACSSGDRAASSGNHGTALALAASRVGIKATIVLPDNAPQVKVERIKKAGATILRHGSHYGDSEEKAAELGKEELVLIHPFDDPRVVAGQGTIGLEIDEDAPSDLEAVLVPVGGGGLISGIALGLKYTRPQVEVIGVESYAAPTLTEALKAKKPVPIIPQPTCADSLSPRYTGDISFEVATDRIRQVILLTEEELIEGVRYCLEELHLVVEPAGAAGISALLAGKVKIKSGPVCVVVSGSNLEKKYFKEALGL